MRLTIAFFISFISLISIAQTDSSQQYTIDWKMPVSVYKGGKSLTFLGATHQDNLPTYSLRFKKKYISKARLKDEVYIPLTESEINLIPKKFNQQKIEPTISYGKERKAWVSSVAFVPIRNNNGVWEKLISFNLKKEDKGYPQDKSGGNYTWKNSTVFRSGTWYKIAVIGSGIYKIDRDFVTSLGVNSDNIDPQNIRIYGNGGKMLPQLNSETWYDDVDENAIYVRGENDGSFDSGDYALFYAQGPTNWSLDTTVDLFTHEKNLYSDTAYYFITFSFSGGKRIQSQSSVSGATATLNTFDDYMLHEENLVNTMHSGRFWYGEKFDFELTKSFDFTTSGVKSSPGVTVTTAIASMSPASPTFQISLNSSVLGSENMTDAQYSIKYPTSKKIVKHWSPVNTSNGSLSVGLTYNKGGSTSSVGYCDYIALNYKRDLRLYGNQTSFRAKASLDQSVTAYDVSSASGATIWDVTDILNVKAQSTSGSGTLSFSQTSDELREYVVFTGSSFSTPTFVEELLYQNLHGYSTPDFVIITDNIFADEAKKLAEHRKDNDGLDVHVVLIDRVYNEFSSGMQDVGAIRNFMKMFYDRADGGKLKYLLLLGDCSYDYKHETADNTNYVPVYESRNSEDPIKSHSSDDFYALLDDNEGYFCEGTGCSLIEYLDIGVGRIPAKTVEEATGVIDKIIHYDDEKGNIQACHSAQSHTSGKWRNEIVLIADDSDGNAHFRSADEKIYPIMKNYPNYHVNKIYIDAYEQISGAGGQSAPQVKAKINARMDRGALIFNYSGHGGELGLSHEGVISVPQIKAWDNIDNMPLMFTATCEFGRYDDPERTSGGEYTLLNPDGGVVSIVTTTRPVYTSGNDNINIAFFSSVFEPLDTTTGEMPRLGDVMRSAKNGSQSATSVNNRNFALLGDPSLRLSYPQENVVLTKINNFSVVDTLGDTISALSKVTMEGEIRNADDLLIDNFDGVLEASIYDKLNVYKTLGDENGSPVPFDARDIKIFEGLASVTDGKFKFSFIVPKDIKYTYGNGKAIFYAESDNLKTNGNGSDLSFVVGGTATNFDDDQTPPEISLYMNDETFVNGGTTNESPVFLAKLFDEHGINTTGVGIGHELSSILDNNQNNTLVLNDFYTSELDDYQKGIVEYPLEDLLPGRHQITLKAWDTYNNSNEEYLEFLVINEKDLSLQHILNYPNPFTTNTEFHFDHNRACDDLEVRVQVFTVSGKLIKTINMHIPHAPAHISDIFWDGKDDYGDNIGRGVYVYKVKVRSLTDGSQVHEYQKLVILK